MVGFVAVAVLSYAVYLLIVALIDAIKDKGDAVAVHSTWGGFGNGAGGWSLSTSLSLLLAAGLVGGFAVALGSVVLQALNGAPAQLTTSTQSQNASGTDESADNSTEEADSESSESEADKKAAQKKPQRKKPEQQKPEQKAPQSSDFFEAGA